MISDLRSLLRKRRGIKERSWCWFTCLLFFVALTLPADLVAQQRIPGEGQTGLFYTVTHLHPAAYLILFLVFLLSVANLVFQFGLSKLMRPLMALVSVVRGDSDVSEVPPVLKGLKRSRIGNSRQETEGHPRRRKGEFVPRDEAVIAVRRPSKSVQTPSASVVPTPLEGVNHDLPELTEPASHQSGAPRVSGANPDRKVPSSEFRFSSAVDVPTPEEMERREKTQLTVTGSVLGPDGKGVSSAIVYLTDEEGNRVGQSCRSMPETGEFKVLINEPGKYRINGYKRGFVMEQSEPQQIPIESGKIEGFNFRMIPEGCFVSGRVVREDSGVGIPEHDVSCVCRTHNYERSARTESDGHFRISGVPVNSECFLEVREKTGGLLATTDTFQTVQKKEMHSEIKISGPAAESPEEPQASPETDREHTGVADTMNASEQQSTSGAPTDQPEDSEILPPKDSVAPPAS